jgi:hypothetical protein
MDSLPTCPQVVDRHPVPVCGSHSFPSRARHALTRQPPLSSPPRPAPLTPSALYSVLQAGSAAASPHSRATNHRRDTSGRPLSMWLATSVTHVPDRTFPSRARHALTRQPPLSSPPRSAPPTPSALYSVLQAGCAAASPDSRATNHRWDTSGRPDLSHRHLLYAEFFDCRMDSLPTCPQVVDRHPVPVCGSHAFPSRARHALTRQPPLSSPPRPAPLTPSALYSVLQAGSAAASPHSRATNHRWDTSGRPLSLGYGPTT